MRDVYSCSYKTTRGIRSLYADGQIITQATIYYHDHLQFAHEIITKELTTRSSKTDRRVKRNVLCLLTNRYKSELFK